MSNNADDSIERLRRTLADLLRLQNDQAGLADLSAVIAETKAKLLALGDTTIQNDGVEALQLRLRAIGLQVPYQLLLSLPYLATIVALALAGRNASYPAALLKPYKREE